ncbi:ATP-binding protein [Algivirga pacifica]|uniref:ATP-binding protein n=1 Tax=Algivirga pacifica TaxID=1162670 RepID=A0ABP9DJX7_9BACT
MENKRYLKKVVYINAASLPYSEVEVGGNIHFVGSNGFGKTTVLRTILFFYNPTSNKSELGIRENQRSFSDYYFEQLNSYIIYEVARETGDYCIVCYKSGGRMQFRIVDAPYNKDYYISPDMQVYLPEEVWDNFRKDDLRCSEEPIIKYGDLRNIIYGSTQLRRYRGYGLLQARIGQTAKRTASIPKAIANIFRSSGLNSDYIKKSVIDAVVEEEQKPIDLSVIERHLRKFRDALQALETFEKSRDLADDIINAYQEVVDKESHLEKVANTLGLVVKRTQANLAKMRKEEEQLEEKLLQLQEVYDTEAKEREEQVVSLNQQVGEQNSVLKNIERLKKEYENIEVYGQGYSIEEVLEKAGEELSVKDRLSNEEATLRTLTAKAEEVERMFNSQQVQLDSAMESFRLNTEREKNESQAAYHEKQEQIRQQSYRKQQEATKMLRADLEKAERVAEEHRINVNELQLQKERIKLTTNSSEAMQLHRNKVHAAEQELTALKGQYELSKATFQNKRVLLESQKESLEQKLKTEEEVLLQERQTLEQKLVLEQKKLEEFEGSLQDYLNQEVGEWEGTIGKLCREEVLMMKDLNPQKAIENTGSFFGLKLDLDKIDFQPAQADDFRERIDKITKKLQAWKGKFHQAKEEMEVKLQQFNEGARKELRELDEAVQELYGKVASTDNKVKRLHLEQETLADKLKNEQDAALKSIEKELEEAFQVLETAREELNKVRTRMEELQATQEEEKDELLREARLQYENALEKLKEKLQTYEQEYANNKEELQQRRTEQLHSSGVDTEEVKSIELTIGRLKEELKVIEQCKEWKNKYQVHRSDIEQEHGVKEQLQLLEERLQVLKSQQEQRKATHQQQTKELRHNLQEVTNSIRDDEKELYDDYAYFKQDHTSPYFLYMSQIDHPQEEEEALGEAENIRLKQILQLMRTTFQDKNMTLGRMKERIKKYVEKFPENNVLNFPTKFSTVDDEEYRLFVSTLLLPFIKEEKYIQIREQMERQHGGIIKSIANEVQDLSSASSKISETIRKINSDFENSNFVGVVKSIQLDFRKNDTGIIRLLKNIKQLEGQNVFGEQSEVFKPQSTIEVNKDSKKLLNDLIKAIDNEPRKFISIHDNFDLLFRVQENNNDTNWVEKLSSVGSEGTDVLVKSMIYITLLNVFKQNAFKNNDNYLLHCMIDEVGKLSDSYLSDLIQFTNDKNIRLIFGSPNENDPLIYHHVYKIHRLGRNKAQVVKLVGEA